jgi:hypothetical protein
VGGVGGGWEETQGIFRLHSLISSWDYKYANEHFLKIVKFTWKCKETRINKKKTLKKDN